MKKYFWDEQYLFRDCANGMIQRCVIEYEMWDILKAFH